MASTKKEGFASLCKLLDGFFCSDLTCMSNIYSDSSAQMWPANSRMHDKLIYIKSSDPEPPFLHIQHLQMPFARNYVTFHRRLSSFCQNKSEDYEVIPQLLLLWGQLESRHASLGSCSHLFPPFLQLLLRTQYLLIWSLPAPAVEK